MSRNQSITRDDDAISPLDPPPLVIRDRLAMRLARHPMDAASEARATAKARELGAYGTPERTVAAARMLVIIEREGYGGWA